VSRRCNPRALDPEPARGGEGWGEARAVGPGFGFAFREGPVVRLF
jgi:hypothetical protein